MRKKLDRLPEMFCACGAHWCGTAPIEAHEYIKNEWLKKHATHLNRIVPVKKPTPRQPAPPPSRS